MSIDLSEPVTTDGALKLTQAEYDYLNSFLAVKDRGGYYLALYNMTGSQEALLQAQITTLNIWGQNIWGQSKIGTEYLEYLGSE